MSLSLFESLEGRSLFSASAPLLLLPPAFLQTPILPLPGEVVEPGFLQSHPQLQPIAITGTDGPDRILISQSGNTLTVDTNGQKQTFELDSRGLVTLNAGAGDDIVVVDASVERYMSIWGEAGNDHIEGNGARAFIDGGDGDDVIAGGVGGDTLIGGAGDDLIVAGGGNDLVNGGAGNDRIFAGDGRDEVHGNDGNDSLDGGAGKDRVFGETGDDDLFGHGRDRLSGGEGNDILHRRTRDSHQIQFLRYAPPFSSQPIDRNAVLLATSRADD